jgi:hypothetical protein
VNGSENRLVIMSAPDEGAKAAWVGAVRAAKSDKGDEASDAPDAVDAKTIGDELLAALEKREEEEAAKRRLRRKTFLRRIGFSVA